GALAQRDGMYIPKNLDPGQTYWGQKFINYAAAAENIGAFGKEVGGAPLHPDATIPDYMEQNDAFPTSQEEFDRMITVPPGKTAEYGAAWGTKFNNILE
ncbi:hypothetical protein SAMN05216564_1221, partial [Halopenitus persicus]